MNSCDQICDLTTVQAVPRWLSFVHQASWQRKVSPRLSLGYFLTICAQSLTGLFTVHCLVPLPYFCYLHCAEPWDGVRFFPILKYKRSLWRPFHWWVPRLIQSGVMEDAPSSGDQITGLTGKKNKPVVCCRMCACCECLTANMCV